MDGQDYMYAFTYLPPGRGTDIEFSITKLDCETGWIPRLLWSYYRYSNGGRFFYVRVNRFSGRREMLLALPQNDNADRWVSESSWWNSPAPRYEREDFEQIERETLT